MSLNWGNRRHIHTVQLFESAKLNGMEYRIVAFIKERPVLSVRMKYSSFFLFYFYSY